MDFSLKHGSETEDAHADEPKAVAAAEDVEEEAAVQELDGTLGRVAPAVVREPGFSRDLIDTYLRHMGGELLTREQEVALAERIEAAQAVLLDNFCRVPLPKDRCGWATSQWSVPRLPTRPRLVRP
jgi:hypothetical protein